jgi:hypothetical protein
MPISSRARARAGSENLGTLPYRDQPQGIARPQLTFPGHVPAILSWSLLPPVQPVLRASCHERYCRILVSTLPFKSLDSILIRSAATTRLVPQCRTISQVAPINASASLHCFSRRCRSWTGTESDGRPPRASGERGSRVISARQGLPPAGLVTVRAILCLPGPCR